jgi:tetratricopeptide (TPR) repeat protein
LPDTVALSIQRRLLSLPEDERAVLACAALGSRTGACSAGLVAALSRRAPADVVAVLRRLWARGLVLPQPATGLLVGGRAPGDGAIARDAPPAIDDDEYVLASGAVQHAAAGLVPDTEAADLHARAARWLVEWQGSSLQSTADASAPPASPERFDLVAWHHEQAGEWAQAHAALLAAAEAAERSGHLGETVRHLRHARDLGRTWPRVVGAAGEDAPSERIADHLMALGGYAEAARELAAVAARDGGTASDRFRVRLKLGRAHGFAYALTDALPPLDWCLDHLDAASGPADVAAVHAWLGWLHLLDKSYEAAAGCVAAAEGALAAWSEAGSSAAGLKQIAVVHNVKAMLLMRRGRAKEAVVEMDRCVELHGRLGDLFGLASAYGNRAVARHEAGDLTGAAADLMQAVSIMLDKLRNPFTAAIFTSNLAQVHLDAGRPAEARRALERAAAIERDQPADPLRAEILRRLADAWRLAACDPRVTATERDAHLATARAFATQALAVADARRLTEELGATWRALGEIEAAAGEQAAAQAAFARALEHVPEGDPYRAIVLRAREAARGAPAG